MNIVELAVTPNVDHHLKEVQNAIENFFDHSCELNYYAPFIHITRIDSNTIHEDPKAVLEKVFEIIDKIRFGDLEFSEKQIGFIAQLRKAKKQFAFYVDEGAKKIDRKKLTKVDRLKGVRKHSKDWIKFLVKTSTGNKYSIKDDFEWKNIELLQNTFDFFFYDLELQSLKIENNDLYDLSILAYVQPEVKYFTREKRIKKLITRAKMNHYLLSEND